MGAITPEAVSVETICVINAALVHYHIAQAQGRRRALVRRVWERALAAEAEAEVAEEEGVEGGADEKATTRPLRRGRMLMTMMRRARRRRRPRYSSRLFDCWAWRSIYVTHRSERTFLEYSSGVPFQRWRALVATLGKGSRRRRRVGSRPPECDARGMLRPRRRRLVANRATPPTN